MAIGAKQFSIGKVEGDRTLYVNNVQKDGTYTLDDVTGEIYPLDDGKEKIKMLRTKYPDDEFVVIV